MKLTLLGLFSMIYGVQAQTVLLLGTSTSGSIGLWVDIGTEGYFKEFKIFN